MKLLLSLVILLFLLTACGGGGGGSGQIPETPLNQVQISQSTVSGVPGSQLIAYLKEMAYGPWGPEGDMFGEGGRGFSLWENPPIVRTETGADPEHRRMVERAVDQLNDWLPVENRMIIGEPTDRQPQGRTNSGQAPNTREVPDGEIHISFRDAFRGGVQHPYNETSLDSESGREVRNMVASLVEVAPHRPDGHAVYGIIIHEMIHALGLHGHVPESVHPDTLLPDAGALPDETGLQDIPRIDGEALMTIYSRYTRGEGRDDINPTSLGPWASSIPAISANIRTEGGSVSFGAEYRSQWIRVWDEGPMPSTPLSQSGILGTATWNGDIVGFTDDGVSTRGDAEITVEMQTMNGGAEFSNIMSEEASWGSDLSYSLSINGNHFSATNTDDALTGQFRGSNHEAVTGVLDTNNLTGAFGGNRE